MLILFVLVSQIALAKPLEAQLGKLFLLLLPIHWKKSVGACSKCSVDKRIRCIYIAQVSSFASSRVIVGTCADTYQIPEIHSSSRLLQTS